MQQSHKYLFLLKGLAYLGEYPLAYSINATDSQVVVSLKGSSVSW